MSSGRCWTGKLSEGVGAVDQEGNHQGLAVADWIVNFQREIKVSSSVQYQSTPQGFIPCHFCREGVLTVWTMYQWHHCLLFSHCMTSVPSNIWLSTGCPVPDIPRKFLARCSRPSLFTMLSWLGESLGNTKGTLFRNKMLNALVFLMDRRRNKILVLLGFQKGSCRHPFTPRSPLSSWILSFYSFTGFWLQI